MFPGEQTWFIQVSGQVEDYLVVDQMLFGFLVFQRTGYTLCRHADDKTVDLGLDR